MTVAPAPLSATVMVFVAAALLVGLEAVPKHAEMESLKHERMMTLNQWLQQYQRFGDAADTTSPLRVTRIGTLALRVTRKN